MNKSPLTVTQYSRLLEKEWDTEKNLGLEPDEVSIDSNMLAWWKNEENGSFQMEIKSRVVQLKKPSVKEHEVYKEWHPVNNKGLNPEELTLGSNKKVWWICEHGHEWQSVVKSRISGSGCPFCFGKKVSKANSLATLNPELTKEWHPINNRELKPKDVTSGSAKKVWWLCEEGHEWEAAIYNRKYGRGCPYCYGKKKGGKYEKSK